MDSELENENAKLRAVGLALADKVREVKLAASYNRHKYEHNVTRSLWRSLCDQEKVARSALGEKND